MSVQIWEWVLAVAFLAVCAACFYLSLPLGSRKDRFASSDRGARNVDVRWRRASLVRLLIGLLLIALLLPFLIAARNRCVDSMFNNPRDWISKQMEADREFATFTWQFQESDAVIASWPGCHVDDKRLATLAKELSAPDDPHRLEQCRLFFNRTMTGYHTLRELMAPPLSLTRAEAIQRLKGSLVGRDGRTSCAIIQLTRTGVVRRGEAVDLLRDITEQVSQVPPDEVILGGAAVDGLTIDRLSAASAGKLSIPSNILVLLLCRFCLRSWRLTFVVFAVAMFGQLLTVALVDWSGHPMNAILMALPPLLLVLTVSAGVHLANYYYDEVQLGGPDGAPRRAMAKGWLPCVMAASTTVLGLLSLLVSDSAPIAMFGVFAAVSLVATISLLFLLLPGAVEFWRLAPQTTGEARPPGSTQHNLLDRMANAVIAHHRPILAACVAIMLIAAYGLSGMNTSVNIRALFLPGSRTLEDYGWLESNLGPTVPIETVLRFRTKDDVPMLARLRLVHRVHQAVSEIKSVDGVVSAATFLPDLPADGSETALRDLGIPLRELAALGERIKEMHYLYETSHTQHWRITARVPALTDVDYGTFLAEVRARVEPLLAETAQQYDPKTGDSSVSISATYTGPMPLAYNAQHALLDDLIESFVTALVLITGVMIVYLRSVRAGLIAMLPNVFPTVLLFGLTSLAGVPINIGAIMTASVALGIAVDDTLHYLTWYRRELAACGQQREAVRRAYHHCARAMIQSTLICGLGLLVYSLSSFVPTRRFAYMMATLLLAALAGDLLLLPALLVGPMGRWLKTPEPETTEPTTSTTAAGLRILDVRSWSPPAADSVPRVLRSSRLWL